MRVSDVHINVGSLRTINSPKILVCFRRAPVPGVKSNALIWGFSL